MQNLLTNPAQLTSYKFKKLCKGKIKNMFQPQWSSKIMNQGVGCKLRFYKQFKNEFIREPYLDFINNYHLRRIISKFRCSDHKLEIEIGRHKGDSIDDRLCQLCRGSVETELHFLTECPLYRKIRLKFFGPNSYESWKDILQCKDQHLT